MDFCALLHIDWWTKHIRSYVSWLIIKTTSATSAIVQQCRQGHKMALQGCGTIVASARTVTDILSRIKLNKIPFIPQVLCQH